MSSTQSTSGELAAQAFTAATKVVAPATFLTALLYYFGWIREGAVFGYFGVDQSTLGFSTTDYLLRSAEIAFRPLTWLFAVAAAILTVYLLLRAQLSRSPRKACLVVSLTLAALGVFLSIDGIAVVFGYADLPRDAIRAPITFGLGVTILECGLSLILTSRPSVEVIGRRGLSALLVGVAIFWATTLYAQQLGGAVARRIGANPTSAAGVVVYSSRDLNITGPGVLASIGVASSGYKYRYCGLRLFIHGAGRWLLFPEGYNHAAGDAVIVIPDDSTTRIDVSPPGSNRARRLIGCLSR